jgi:hypothetical protein
VLLCALLALACSRDVRRPRKTHLARLPASVEQIAIADDATTYAYVEKNDKQGRVVHDGVPEESFEVHTGVVFSPRTRKLFYWAGSPTVSGYLVTDGTKFGGFVRDGKIVFSSDGRRWATAGGAVEPGSVIVLADGMEVGRYPDASVPAFSTDDRHLAYLVAAEDGGTRLIVDGSERATYPKASMGCAARKKPEPAGPNFWPQFQVKYLSDGSLLVMTQDADGWGIYREGTRVASYEASVVQRHPTLPPECATVGAIAAWSLVAAEKAPVAVWWERSQGSEERWRVVRDGQPVDDLFCAGPWLLQPPEISPDGRHVAYPCTVREPAEGVLMVADGRRYGSYREMWAYVWSDDGAHIAYGAADASEERPWRYYVDGEPRTDAFAAVWRPLVEAGRGRVVWEGKPDEEARGVLGIEGRRLASFDEVVWGPKFLRRGIVTWVIRRERRLTRLDVPLR